MEKTEQCYKCDRSTSIKLSCDHRLCTDCFPNPKSEHIQNVIHLCEVCESFSLL